MKKHILASKEATNENLDPLFKGEEEANMDDDLLKQLQELQQRVEKQEELISELNWKVDELYSEHKAAHDPYLYD